MDAPVLSPFLGGGLVTEPAAPAALYSEPAAPGLVSPFADALSERGGYRGYESAEPMELLIGELQDEAFEDAVQALVDEAAALHLSSPWATEADGVATVQGWASRVTEDARQLLEHLESTFEGRTPESITEAEIDMAAAGYLPATASPAVEQFFGGLIDKVKKGFKAVKKVATSVARTGIAALGKITGLGQITGILKKLVAPLVKRVVNKALNLLPPAVRGPAQALAAKLSGGVVTATELAEEFDRQYAEAMTAPNDAAVEHLFAQAEDAAVASGEDPLGELDDARARLAAELADAPPGEAPVAPIENFIPAVMAAMPLVRAAIGIIGRDRIKKLLAAPLATFITPFVGRDAARSLAPHIADAGMRLLKLEREDPATLGTEALVSAIEETVRQVLTLPEESLADDVRVGAETQDAFAEAAARYLPSRLLRADLDTGESGVEGAGWIMMPRTARPRYRYRVYSRPCPVTLSRPAARAIVYDGGETLEDRLLDAGVTAWPAEVDVRLYEAMPGTHAGHLLAEEADDELGDLTPEAAALLQLPPGLGRPSPGTFRHRGPRPGQRFFRVGGLRRKVRRLALLWDTSAAQPVLRVHLRIGERAAHAIAAQLDKRAHAQVISTVRRLLGPAARQALAQRLGKLRALNTPTPVPAERRQAIAEALAEAMLTALSKELPAAGAALGEAARDPAPGITVTFAFPYPDVATLRDGAPGTPTVTIRPGQRRD